MRNIPRKFKAALCAATALMITTSAAHASFIANFHRNFDSNNTNTLFVFGADGTDVTVSNNNGFNQNFSIDASGVFELTLGTAAQQMSTSGVVNGFSLLVESNDPISGLALNNRNESTDMTTLLDTEALSREYLVLTNREVFEAQMSVTATEDNTTVTIESPVSLGSNGAGVPFQVVLDKGESIFYESGADLSGTSVKADKDIAVFGGARCTNAGGVQFCDHLIQQQFGVENFDTEFLVAQTPFAGADQDLVRVLAAEDGTEVFVNGASQGTINAGEVLTISSLGNAKITSSKPVTVGQFMRGQAGSRTVGDPAFALLPSVDQFLDAYAFSTPVGTAEFAQNQLNIAIDQSIAASLELNGSSVDTSGFTLIDGILYGSIDIASGAGTISASDGFLATISGFDSFDSYLTPIASAFSPGVSPPPPPPPPPTNEIPLPASSLLLLGGLGAFGAMKRRKRKQSS